MTRAQDAIHRIKSASLDLEEAILALSGPGKQSTQAVAGARHLEEAIEQLRLALALLQQKGK